MAAGGPGAPWLHSFRAQHRPVRRHGTAHRGAGLRPPDRRAGAGSAAVGDAKVHPHGRDCAHLAKSSVACPIVRGIVLDRRGLVEVFARGCPMRQILRSIATWSIKTKLLAGFACVLAILLAVAGIGYYRFLGVADSLQDYVQRVGV